MYIPVVLGTARKERRSENAANFVVETLKSFGAEPELFDVKDYIEARTIPPWEDNPKAAPWKDAVKKADAIVIVSPEYNHGYPGDLKIFLDSLYDEYRRKPVGICGVSSGGLGGARMVEALIPVLVDYYMLVARNAVYFSKMKELFDENGNIDEGQKETYAERLKTLYDELSELRELSKNI